MGQTQINIVFLQGKLSLNLKMITGVVLSFNMEVERRRDTSLIHTVEIERDLASRCFIVFGVISNFPHLTFQFFIPKFSLGE